jgi:hypothetical protein
VWVALGYQLLRWMAPSVADDLLRSGIFAPLLRGVHRVRGAPRLAEQYAFAAALRARPDATVTRYGDVRVGARWTPSSTALGSSGRDTRANSGSRGTTCAGSA